MTLLYTFTQIVNHEIRQIFFLKEFKNSYLESIIRLDEILMLLMTSWHNFAYVTICHCMFKIVTYSSYILRVLYYQRKHCVMCLWNNDPIISQWYVIHSWGPLMWTTTAHPIKCLWTCLILITQRGYEGPRSNGTRIHFQVSQFAMAFSNWTQCISFGRKSALRSQYCTLPWWLRTGPRLNIKTILSTYGDFHVKDKTAVRTSYL